MFLSAIPRLRRFRHVGSVRGSLSGNKRNKTVSRSSSTPPPPLSTKLGKVTELKTERKLPTRKQAIPTELADHYASLLRKCGEARNLSQGKVLHQDIRQAGIETDRYVGNLLLQMYGRCGALQDACLVFDHMPKKNVFTWNLMMGAYIDNGLYKKALKAFQCMLRGAISPDAVTLVSALMACTTLFSLAQGKWIHAYISRHDFKSNTLVGTALLNLYAKCRSLDEAWTMFDALIMRDSVSWNAMVVACAQNKLGKEALQLLQGMHMEGLMPTKVTLASILDACANFAVLHEGKRVHVLAIHSGSRADVALDTALVNMYARCGQLEDAESLFHEMPQQNLVSWSAMIATYAQHGQSTKVLQVSREMQRGGVIPNESITIA